MGESQPTILDEMFDIIEELETLSKEIKAEIEHGGKWNDNGYYHVQ